MPECQSIKPAVLQTLETHMPEIRKRFSIESLCLFGSVCRGEDTPKSDIGILYTFLPGKTTLDNLEGLQTCLEELFDRNIDLISKKWLNPFFRDAVLKEAVPI